VEELVIEVYHVKVVGLGYYTSGMTQRRSAAREGSTSPLEFMQELLVDEFV